MSNKNKDKGKEQEHKLNQEQTENTEVNNTLEENQTEETAETAPEENELDELSKLKSLVTEHESQIESQKKEYLFLMAEFDNFRKRTLRERTELVKTAAESAFKGLLPIVDDFERGLAAIKDSADADTVKEGMELIYNKLIKYLEKSGVKAMNTTGEAFDAEIHEAVALVPATEEKMKGVIIDTIEKGYTYNDKILRHAKVVVCQ